MGPWENCCVQTLLVAGAGGHLEELWWLARHPAVAGSRVGAVCVCGRPASGGAVLGVPNSRGQGTTT